MYEKHRLRPILTYQGDPNPETVSTASPLSPLLMPTEDELERYGRLTAPAARQAATRFHGKTDPNFMKFKLSEPPPPPTEQEVAVNIKHYIDGLRRIPAGEAAMLREMGEKYRAERAACVSPHEQRAFMRRVVEHMPDSPSRAALLGQIDGWKRFDEA